MWLPGLSSSIQQLWDNSVEDGRELREAMKDGRSLYELRESGEAISTADFANITGQIVYSKVMEPFQNAGLIHDALFRNVPTKLSGEKIPGIALVGDEIAQVNEGKPYPLAGMGYNYIETPETVKRGVIVGVTKEAIFYDRTGQVLQHASRVGEFMAINKTKRCLDVAFGITSVYNRNGGGAQATYGDTHTQGDFDNLAASNALVDYTDIQTATLLFDAMTDPNTGEPITPMPNTLVAPSALEWTAKNILNATEIRTHVGGYATSGNLNDFASPNPVSGLSLLSGPWIKARTSSASTWFIGDPQKAFVYMENWPATVTRAPVNSEAEFERDIVERFKVSECGAAAVEEPRHMVKCTA